VSAGRVSAPRGDPRVAAVAARAARRLPVRPALCAPVRCLLDPPRAAPTRRGGPRGRMPPRPGASADAAPEVGRVSELLLEGRDLVKHFPVKRSKGRRARSRRRLARGPSGRDPRRRRRVRLRQSRRSAAARAAPRADERHRALRGRRHHQSSHRRQLRPYRREMPDDLPGPIRVPESAEACRADRRRPVSRFTATASGKDVRRRVQELLEVVGLVAGFTSTAIRTSSRAAKRQRIGVARALALTRS